MPRFTNILGGVLDNDTNKKWKLGSDTNRTHAQAEAEVDDMRRYSMPTMAQLQELNTATTAELTGCNLSVFVAKRIWAATGCLGTGIRFDNIDLGDGEDDQCSPEGDSTNFRALGIR